MSEPEKNNSGIVAYSPAALERVTSQVKSIIKMKQVPVGVGIDGPAAGGKGLATRNLKEIGYKELGFGIFVRSISWLYGTYFSRRSLRAPDFLHAVEDLEINRVPAANGELIQLTNRQLFGTSNPKDFHPHSTDPTVGLRSPLVNKYLSAVSKAPAIVDNINQRLRVSAEEAFEEKTPIAIEGRDIYNIFAGKRENGTAWFDTMVLIYLTASNKVLKKRAVMRHMHNTEQIVSDDELRKVENDLIRRNRRDMSNPMGYGKLLSVKEASQRREYTIIDSTHMSADEVFFWVLVYQLQKLST